ncbi:MAG TPA: twin-arginine translocation signal domain-containing protein, partial [Acidobacteriota bacterium]|nr:twin-arginine translocation signal domain-containing protein [Acidobacteriota bacterium]
MYEKYIRSLTRRDFVKNAAVGTATAAIMGAGISASSAADSEVFTLDRPLGDKYSQYLFTGLKDELSAMIPSFGAPAPYFRGAWQIPGASINIGWQVVTRPNFMEKEGHHHLVDEYFAFFGAQVPDIWSSFDAEIELCLGPDEEKHIITEPTFVFIPKGLHHCPCNFKIINKPLLFQAIHLG